MDDLFNKDALSEAYEPYTQFDRFSRTPEMTMDDFIIEFKKYYNRTKKLDMSLPEVVLAFKLLDCTGLEHKDRQLVLTGVDCKNTGDLFNQMKMSSNKFFGEQSKPTSYGTRGAGPSIKIEPTFVTENKEEAHYANKSGYRTDRIAIEVQGVVVSVIVEEGGYGGRVVE